jgi:site-specific DNA-methyltransferase (adenine-specific)
MTPDKEYVGKSTIRMYNADCMELLATGKKWDLAIVDPPYGIGESNKNFASRSNLANADRYVHKEWDNNRPTQEYFYALELASKNQVVWGGNHLVEKTTPCMIVWDKQNGDNDFADCELAWTSFKSAVRKFTHKWNGMLQQDMKNKEHRIHPTQKPVKLYKWLLKNYAKPGDTILDTHGGSMSIAIACWDMGFNLDICELDSDYFNDAVKRFENHIAQTVLF